MIKPHRTKGDDGATLVIVLVLVTFIAVVLGVILSQADTSARVTVGLSDQAANQYAADGAGQAGITRLRQGTYPNLCATTGGDTLPLGSGGSPFYDSTASSGTSYNATVTCTPDNTSTGGGGVIGSGNKPGFTMLTVGTAAAKVEHGQSYPKKDVPFANGDVISNSDIDGSDNIDLDPPYKVRAVACDKAPCVPIAAPGMADPNYAAPAAAVSPAPAPVCSADHAYVAFRPGLYTSADVLNSGCWSSNAIAWFSPGSLLLRLHERQSCLERAESAGRRHADEQGGDECADHRPQPSNRFDLVRPVCVARCTRKLRRPERVELSGSRVRVRG